MRRTAILVLTVSAACWLAAGPGGVTVQALLACRHHAAHLAHTHGGHSLPAGAPCFCDEMTGGSDLVVSPALPAPVVVQLIAAVPAVRLPPVSRFPSPVSRVQTPLSPPPNLPA